MRVFDPKDSAYQELKKESFVLHQQAEALHDAKFETKPISFFRDAMQRFGKNSASIVPLRSSA